MVEDNPGDVRLAQEALRDARIVNPMHVVRDGEEALAFLRRQGKYSGIEPPGVVFLDINLPKVDGIEVLMEMRSDPTLKDIPVVVLTASVVDQQVLRQNRVQADCFVVKPLTADGYMEAVRCFPSLALGILRVD